MRILFFFLSLVFATSFQFGANGATTPQPSWRIDALWEAMQDPCFGTQRAAVQFLSGRPAPDYRIAMQLNSLLRDPKWKQDRAMLLSAVSSTGTNQVACADAVFGLLEDEDKTIRSQAIDTLGRMPLNAGQITRLSKKLRDPDTYVRQRTIAALTNLADYAFLKEIARAAVTNTDSGFQLTAMDAIANAGTNSISCLSEVVQLSKSEDPSIRSKAVETLGKLPTIDEDCVNVIIDLSTDEDEHVRYKAVETLAKLNNVATNVSFVLKKIFENGGENWDTRKLAISAYSRGAMGDSFVDEKAASLDNPSAIIRSNILVVLEQTGKAGLRAASLVRPLLRDASPLVRQHAIDTLFAFDDHGTNYSIEIATLLDDPDKGVRAEAFNVLIKMDGAGQITRKQLLKIMANDNYPAREQILEILATGSKTAEVAKIVSSYLNDSDPLVRSKAIKMLNQMAGPGDIYLPQIGRLFKDPVESVRNDVVTAVSRMMTRGALCPLKAVDLLNDPNPHLRMIAVDALKQESGTNSISRLVALLDDTDQRVQFSAAIALCDTEESANNLAPEMATWMLDNGGRGAPIDILVHHFVSSDFRLSENFLMTSFELVHEGIKRDEGQNRFWGYLMCGVTTNYSALRRWLGYRSDEERPKDASSKDIRKDMVVIRSVLPKLKNYPETHKEAAEVLAYFARKATWGLADVISLESLASDLRESGFPSQASEVDNIIAKIRRIAWIKARLKNAIAILIAQCVLWLFLLFFYPRNRFVQAFFFWNPIGRNLFGWGYVGFFIRRIRWTRERLFKPFQESLIPKGLLSGIDSISYFDKQEVVEEIKGQRVPKPVVLREFLSRATGQVVLKGGSGLGKTLLLQKRALRAKELGEIAVFLRATDCKNGVLEAIQVRLHGNTKDKAYLRTLIHAGAMELLIDGLNEASPETRVLISNFIGENFKGNFMLTTQPLSEWDSLVVRTYRLQSLRLGQIRAFLIGQWEAVKDIATITSEEYIKGVDGLLQMFGGENRENGNDAQRPEVLQNPMEACLAAELLAKGERPDVFRLVQQRYDSMAKEYKEINHGKFPAKAFAERIYEWRKSDHAEIDMTGFEVEAAELVTHRLMIKRADTVGATEKTRWFFRHERIMDFFLLPAFSEDDKKDRRFTQVDDGRFWGVYDLLARELNKEEAEELYKFLNSRAARINENELRNRYELSYQRRKG